MFATYAPQSEQKQTCQKTSCPRARWSSAVEFKTQFAPPTPFPEEGGGCGGRTDPSLWCATRLALIWASGAVSIGASLAVDRVIRRVGVCIWRRGWDVRAGEVVGRNGRRWELLRGAAVARGASPPGPDPLICIHSLTHLEPLPVSQAAPTLRFLKGGMDHCTFCEIVSGKQPAHMVSRPLGPSGFDPPLPRAGR